MAIAAYEEAFLRAAARDGVCFDRTVMLGRQRWGDGYAEPLFESFGATEVRSIDASAYEHASDIHDLNEPLLDHFAGRFTVAVESGTPSNMSSTLTEALRSAMRLPVVGGHLVLMTPCNNAPGHGLHQLTPELLYRSLSPDHGYTVKRFLLREERGDWYQVRDPAVVGRRCEFRTRRTAYLFVLAERSAEVPVFASWPQQGDYSAEWAGTTPTMSRSGQLLTRTPAKLRRLAFRLRARSWPPYYTRRTEHFRRIDL